MHRKSLTRALDASLQRLGLDYIDLYYVHWWDFTTPVEEVQRALDDAVSAGKILHIGLSDVPAWVVSRAQRSEEHTSEIQYLMRISYAVFRLTKKITMMYK